MLHKTDARQNAMQTNQPSMEIGLYWQLFLQWSFLIAYIHELMNFADTNYIMIKIICFTTKMKYHSFENTYQYDEKYLFVECFLFHTCILYISINGLHGPSIQRTLSKEKFATKFFWYSNARLSSILDVKNTFVSSILFKIPTDQLLLRIYFYQCNLV